MLTHPSQTLNNTVSILFSNRGLCYKYLKKWDFVQRDAKEAVRLSSDNAKAHWLLGTAHFAREQWEEAIPAFERAESVRSQMLCTMERSYKVSARATLQSEG